MFKMIATLLLVLLVGCANEEAAPPFAVVYDNSWTPEGGAAVGRAREQWNARTGEELLVLADTAHLGACNNIYVKFVDVIEVGRTSVGRYTEKGCNFELKLAPAGVMDPTTIEHELGHILGLDDSDEPESVMFWTTTRWETTITDQNVADVRAYWGLLGS